MVLVKTVLTQNGDGEAAVMAKRRPKRGLRRDLSAAGITEPGELAAETGLAPRLALAAEVLESVAGRYPAKLGYMERADWYLGLMRGMLGSAILAGETGDALQVIRTMYPFEQLKARIELMPGRMKLAITEPIDPELERRLEMARERRAAALGAGEGPIEIPAAAMPGPLEEKK